MTQNSPHDLDDLSAYLDQALEPRETARLEERLRTDHRLQAELDSLRRTREVLRRTPQMRAPRNFTLTPEMVGDAPRERSRLLPFTRVVFAMTSIVFVVAMVGNASYVPAALPAAEVTAFEMMEEDPGAAQDAGGSAAAEAAPAEESISLEMAPAAEGDAGIEATEETMEALSPTEESMAITSEEDAASAASAAADAAEPGAAERSAGDTGPAEGEGEIAGDPLAVEAESQTMAETDKLAEPAANPWTLPALVAGAGAALSGMLMLVLRKQ